MEKNVIKRKSQKKDRFSVIVSIGLWCVAVLYILALAKIVVLKNGFNTELRSLSLIPFEFISDFFTMDTSIDVLLKNCFGNFVIFIPMGILLPALVKNIHGKKVVFICFFISLTIEVAQYIVGFGITDIDDLILNTLGGAVGVLLYFKLLKKIDNKAKASIASLSFLSIFGITGVLSLWLYQPNILPPQIKVINQEVMGGINTDKPDIKVLCKDIKDNILFTQTVNTDNPKELKFMVDEDTQFFTKTIGAQYSPNGNVQKTFVTYGKTTKEWLEKLVKEDKATLSLWISEDNKCNAVLVWRWESKE
ncbi:VanZ family protein [Clostridium tetani]|uniref:VanZ family protein n=1 Tax=Clostridium tetani TaxID=1513 RepID=A0ABY0EKC9_CLOTA|nr:VanZ family protein [Clostridium tetani]RXI51213.1 VanZ family protein [Clostridium tetani]RXI65935.1 VanZ family protein [Clostridium tetani]CDI49541.1 VanZ family protein [Clostridium tetani 12124569]